MKKNNVDLDDDDRSEVTARDLTRGALERMLEKALRRRKGERDESPDAADKANKEREDLANLSEEKKGKSNAPAVTKTDFHPADVEVNEDDRDDETDDTTKKKKKKD
jgi:hypothetical protein